MPPPVTPKRQCNLASNLSSGGFETNNSPWGGGGGGGGGGDAAVNDIAITS